MHMLLHVAKCILKQIFTKAQSQGICIEHVGASMSAILSLMRSITYNYFQADRQLLGYWLQPTGLICTLYYLYVLYLLQVWKINIHTYIQPIKQFYITWCMHHVYQRHFNRIFFLISAPRHWQALFKRMNDQVIASVYLLYA